MCSILQSHTRLKINFEVFIDEQKRVTELLFQVSVDYKDFIYLWASVCLFLIDDLRVKLWYEEGIESKLAEIRRKMT